MNIKNKIIKWLGGYTEEDMVHAVNKLNLNIPVKYSRIEKQLIPITVKFATTALDHADIIKNNLCYQVAEFIFKYNLLYYDISRNETNDCYIVRAVVYVREP